MDTLDNNTKKLLAKDNPNAPVTAQPKGVSSLRAPLGRSATVGAPGRPSVKEAILASKRSRGDLRPQPERSETFASLPAIASTPVPPPASSGRLASAPVRPQRPKNGTRPEKQYPDPQAFPRAVSPPGAFSASRSNGVRSPPLCSPPRIHERLARGMTPARQQSPLSGNSGRKLTVLEQLNHADWKVRVEGVIIVACILARRTPPNYDGQKMPTLPPSDVFAPTLAKLLNDPRPEVVEHVVAPEVLSELVKVVPMDQIAPKVLLLSEGDDIEHSQPITAYSIPALKQLMTEPEATELLFRIITSMGVSGVVPRKLALGSFTTTQKRKIIHGCLVWMNELVESHLNGTINEFLSDVSNFKLYVNRLIAMLNNTRVPNYNPLVSLLKNFQKLDTEAFDKILNTFESQTVRELKKAWGLNVEDEGESIVVEEKVADVEQVLGSVPMIGDNARVPRSPPRNFSPPSKKGKYFPESPQNLTDEDLTMISLPPLPPAPRPVTPTKKNERDNITDLPPLPTTPEKVQSTSHVSARRPSRAEDKNPIIKVYQDPVIESNGAVATSTGGDKGPTNGSGEWYRSKMKKQISNSNLPKTPEHSSRLLFTLTTRLQNREIDTQAFRKLIGIARENPVRAVLQENNGETFHDIWEGGKVFDELLTALLEYLDDDSVSFSLLTISLHWLTAPSQIDAERAADLRVQGLLVLKQLLSKTAPYFTRHEAAVLRTLIDLRGKYPTQSHVTTGIEEIVEEFMAIVDPATGIEAILNISFPLDKPGFRQATQSWCMSLTCLAALVRASKASSLELQFTRLGQLAVKVYHPYSSLLPNYV